MIKSHKCLQALMTLEFEVFRLVSNLSVPRIDWFNSLTMLPHPHYTVLHCNNIITKAVERQTLLIKIKANISYACLL